jgi:hypothetical protein
MLDVVIILNATIKMNDNRSRPYMPGEERERGGEGRERGGKGRERGGEGRERGGEGREEEEKRRRGEEEKRRRDWSREKSVSVQNIILRIEVFFLPSSSLPPSLLPPFPSLLTPVRGAVGHVGQGVEDFIHTSGGGGAFLGRHHGIGEEGDELRQRRLVPRKRLNCISQ